MRFPFFTLALTAVLFACSDNKAEKLAAAVHPPAPPAPKYYFFPKANVYVDSVNRDYVFLSGDGKTWTTEKQIPAVVHGLMDKSILIDSPPQPVWKDNENHRLVYSAVLYATPADTVEKKERRVVAKAEAPDTAEKKERKGGLRRFFDKLFGKKNKDKSL